MMPYIILCRLERIPPFLILYAPRPRRGAYSSRRGYDTSKEVESGAKGYMLSQISPKSM